MVPTIYLKLPWEKRAFPVRLKALRSQNIFYICIEGEGRTPLELGGDTRALVPIYEALKAIIHEQIDYRQGPIAATPPGMFEKKEPDPELANDLMESTVDWPAVASRFPWLADTIPAQYLKKHPAAKKEDEVDQAVAKLLPHRAELLDSEGKPKHGAKTQVAKIMQFSQTGGGFARRIDTLLAALAEVHLEETRKAA